MKKLFIILTVFIVAASTGCGESDSVKIENKTPIVHGNREAPLGWVTFEMYEDSTFKLINAGLRDANVFTGRFEIWDGLIHLYYKDSISDYLGSFIHICGNTLIGEKGFVVTGLSINKLDSIYGNNSYFDCDGLDRDVAANLLFLERHDEIPSYAVGPGADTSEHMGATNHFKKLMSKEDAYILYNHPNSFIKTLAFKKLWYSKDSTVYNKLVESFTDSAVVYEASGCEQYASRLAEYYLNVIEYPSERYESNPTLSSNQKLIIDSLAEEYNYKYKLEQRY